MIDLTFCGVEIEKITVLDAFQFYSEHAESSWSTAGFITAFGLGITGSF